MVKEQTSTDASVSNVEKIRRVENQSGNDDAPANQTEQEEIKTLLDELEDALQSVGTDELRLRVFDSSGTAIDPFDEGKLGPATVSDSVAQLSVIDLQEYTSDVDVFLNLSSVNADYVFEVSTDNSNWREHTRISSSDLTTGGEFLQFETAYQYVRSTYEGNDSDVTTHEASAKGV